MIKSSKLDRRSVGTGVGNPPVGRSVDAFLRNFPHVSVSSSDLLWARRMVGRLGM